MEKFVVDSNVLINLNSYSKDVFPSLWDNFHEMANNGQIFSLKEVQMELSQSHGKVEKYWDGESNFFIELGSDAIECVKQLEKFDEFQRAGENKSYFADPYLVAISMSMSCSVLTDERRINSPNSIPYVCREVGVDHLNLNEFMISQGWRW